MLSIHATYVIAYVLCIATALVAVGSLSWALAKGWRPPLVEATQFGFTMVILVGLGLLRGVWLN
jgi:hypothetical protein